MQENDLPALEHALATARATGDRRGEAKALGNLGNVYEHERYEIQRAADCYEQQLVIVRELGDRRGEATTLCNLGSVYTSRVIDEPQTMTDPQRAIACYEQALPLLRKVGDRQMESNTLFHLGRICLDIDEAQRAVGYCEQWLTVDRKRRDRAGASEALRYLGDAYHKLGDHPQAIQHYEQALAVKRAIQDTSSSVAHISWNLGRLYEARGDLERAVQLMSVYTGHAEFMGMEDMVQQEYEHLEQVKHRLAQQKQERL